MANIKTPDGGFYLDDSQFDVDYQKNVVSLAGGGAGDYLPLAGGTMEANAVVTGTDTLELSLESGGVSAVLGLSAEGVTISNESDDTPTSSVRAIENAIELKANDTTVTVNGTGVDFGGSALKNVNSISSTDGLAIEVDVDMNSHKITELANPASANDAVNKNYVDTTFLKLAGGTMTGAIAMGSQKITGLADASDPGDALNKKVADATYAAQSAIPTNATTATAGIVKQATAIEDSSGATDTALETKFNALLAALRTAGVLASS